MHSDADDWLLTPEESTMMKPTRSEYYARRVREHVELATKANDVEEKTAHWKLVSAYRKLTRKHRLNQVFILKV